MNIEWLAADQLTANDYNPNMVFTAELRLLERSILKQGWIQPLLITPERVVIDGFHRWRLALESELLRAKYGGMVPCATLNVGPDEAMILTVRMNRAKGSHAALGMSALVKRLIDLYGWDPQEVAQEIGANRAEVDLLYQDSIFKERNIAGRPAMNQIGFDVRSVDHAEIQPWRTRAARDHVDLADTPETSWWKVTDVACAGLMRVRREGHRGGRIKGVYVDPAFRRLGLGTALTEYVIEQAINLGATYVEAYAWNSKWYLARGFEVVGRNRHGAAFVRKFFANS